MVCGAEWMIMLQSAWIIALLSHWRLTDKCLYAGEYSCNRLGLHSLPISWFIHFPTTLIFSCVFCQFWQMCRNVISSLRNHPVYWALQTLIFVLWHLSLRQAKETSALCGCWSPSQPSYGETLGTPWTSRQADTGLFCSFLSIFFCPWIIWFHVEVNLGKLRHK